MIHRHCAKGRAKQARPEVHRGSALRQLPVPQRTGRHSLPQHNDYIHSITGCSFYNMAIGVHANFGQAFVRNCHFEGSTDTDMLFSASTHAQSVRRTTSKNRGCSSAWAKALWRNNLPVTMQDCQVEGWTNLDGAVVGYFRGPVTMFECLQTPA